MKLYYSPGACSLAPHYVVNELGLNVELTKVDLKTKKYEGGDYTQVNPKGSVPSLQLDNGQVLTEAAVILQYLADQKTDSTMQPKAGTMERLRCQEWLNFIATELHKGFGPLWHPNTPAEYKTIATETLKKKFTFLSNHLKTNQFLMGSTYTIADAYLFTILSWSKPLKLDLSGYPEILGFLERVKSRPATLKTLQEEGLA